MKKVIYAGLLILISAAASDSAFADGNNFFGANPGGGGSGGAPVNTGTNTDYSHDLPEENNPNAVLPGLNDTTPSKPNNMADFTGDEKRMQKKYKSNILNAEHLILRGSNMMKQAGNNVNSAGYKKGKILKEIGEKSLADLKANTPFPAPDTKTK